MFDSAMFSSAGAPHEAPTLDPEGIAPVVAIATSRDLGELREWLAALDPQAYGQVFVEAGPQAAPAETRVDPAAQTLATPDRVGVTWLRSAERAGAALAKAVDAWFAEWLWVDASEGRSLEMFTAHHAGQALAPYLQRFECRLEKRWPGCSQESCPKLRTAE